MDYYDHYPLVVLDRHLVIAGYLGAETRRIGYQLAALTGLGVTDLDRKIEHHAGKSVWELIWNDGEPRYRQLEQKHLIRLLAEKPRGIITLGDGALIDEANRERVLAQACLVVLDLDLPNCYWRIQSTSLGEKDFWHPLHAGPVERFEQVRPFYELREPGFTQAHHRIELRGKSRGQVVEDLMTILLPGSESTA